MSARRPPPTPLWLPLVAVAVLLAPGCYGGAEDTATESGTGGTVATVGETEGSATEATAGTEGTAGTDGTDTGGDQAELPVPSPRFYRLTHKQWEHTVRDLFNLSQETGFSEQFRSDPKVSGFIFDNNALSLEVDQALWSGYQRAAADVAELVTSDPQITAELFPPDGGDPVARRETFAREFGKRAFRRPPTDAEVQTLVGLFTGALELYPDLSDEFQAGARMVIETVLQSPLFLYRIELSTEIADEVIPLNSWEVAQRMSYFLWDSMPDEELFAAAEAGMLTDPVAVEDQARRMLTDIRAQEVVLDYHHQLLEVEKFLSIAPSDVFFPDISGDLGSYAIAEHDAFLQEVMIAREGSFSDLLTSTTTFVNADLAAIYGLEGAYDNNFVEAELDAATRAGIFTQIGFLAANSSSVNPDPIHRGVFLAKRMSCLTIAAPPDNVPPLPPLDESQTNRQRVEGHTEQEGSACADCHTPLINPYGFAFENYDAVGAYRTLDNGQPVDASASVLLPDGERPTVQNAVELAQILAGSPAVHECYLRHWLEFAMGRPYEYADRPLVKRLGATSHEQNQSIQDMLVELVVSTPFLSRATEELSP